MVERLKQLEYFSFKGQVYKYEPASILVYDPDTVTGEVQVNG